VLKMGAPQLAHRGVGGLGGSSRRRTQHRNGSCGRCWRLTSSVHRAGLAYIVCTLQPIGTLAVPRRTSNLVLEPPSRLLLVNFYPVSSLCW
jgi:hypothetical protein